MTINYVIYSYIATIKAGVKSGFKRLKKFNMIKEVRQDIYTQAEYAKKVGKTRSWVNQKIKAGEIKTLTIKGATLVKE